MRIFWEEIKKIWRLPLCAVILAFCGLAAYLTLGSSLPVEQYDRGNVWGELTNITTLLKRFGSEMDAVERIEADALMDEYFATLESWIAAHPIYAEHGIHNTADLRDCYLHRGAFAWLDDAEMANNSEFDYYVELFSDPLFAKEGGSETGHIMWVVQDLREALKLYDIEAEHGVYGYEILYGDATALQKERANALTERKAFWNINSNAVLQNTTSYAGRAVIIILLSVALLLLPYLVTDNTRGLTQMQWSAKSGRKTLKTQFAAAMFSAFTLVAVEVAIVTGLFLRFNREFLVFRNQFIYSGLSHTPVPWLDLTYAQYGAALIILCFVLSLGAAAVFALLSYKSQSPVTLLFKAIPTYVASAIIGYQVLNASITFSNSISRLTRIPCADVLICAAVPIVGVALCAYSYARAKKTDLVES